MDYKSYVAEASQIYANSKEEQTEMYKRYYINMEKQVAQALASGKAPDIAAVKGLVSRITGDVAAADAVFVNTEQLSNKSDILKSVQLGNASDSFFSNRLYGTGDDKYIAFVRSMSRSAIMIEVPPNTKKELSVLFLNQDCVVPLQISVRIGENSTLNMSEMFFSADGCSNALAASVHEVSAAKGAKGEINILYNQSAGTDLVHFSKSDVGENAHLRMNIMYNGGRNTRARNHMQSSGKEGFSEVNESVMSTTGQKFDLYTYVANAAPKSLCHAEAKAILTGKSSGYVKGFAKILAGAEGSRSYVKERGLILDKGCHVDLIPDMSIDQNDVKATHSGASAPIDQAALFYLMSRGVTPNNAKRLIINGFLADLLSRIDSFEIRRAAFALVHDKITDGRFGHVPKTDMADMWVPDIPKEQSIFGGHYKYKE